MKTLKNFFKHRETFIGIATAFAFLLIFFCVWMTAYDGVTDRVDQLKVGLVNKDKQMGTTIEENLEKNLPFKVKSYGSVAHAKEDMDERNLDMVIQIPANFSSLLKENNNVEIKYFINQANSSLTKQIMAGATKDITQTINKNIYTYKQKLILSNLSKELSTAIPSEELAQKLSENITKVLNSLNIDSVQSSVKKTNNTEGFAATMLPLLIVLASWVGAMIMSLNLNSVAEKLKSIHSKWSIFFTRQFINIVASIILAFITLIFMSLFDIKLNTNVFETWVFQTLVFFSFLSLTQMFVVLFGPAGMVFNIISLSLQLVTFGVIVPKAMLSDFYQTVGSYFPATYVADGYYTVIFGGSDLSHDMNILLFVSLITIGIAMGRIIIQKNTKTKSNTLPTGKNVMVH
ncbi:YhgE/Pip domain-containing protein [Bacillus cereus]|uniref:YhgE/Pip domain-containing protein n=1 Tax=Bacillus cereus TaxID=1396 RepID=UPI001D0DFA23|nr:ABC transporter permease [Bacillus cereus]MCC2386526.1 ABC transporter permease [Bacillus cereus]